MRENKIFNFFFYKIGYLWNRVEFLNSNQFTESNNIEI